MANAERVLGDVATRVLFENERVRIWELRLEPGERSDVHRHERDYVVVQIAGDRIAGHFEPDSEGSYRGDVEGPVRPGRVAYVAKGGIETAVNSGEAPYHEILIELK
jgi:hypothetical protein